MASDLTVTAIIAAYNEGDVITHVIDDLIRQGVAVYLLDNGSTDDTRQRLAPYLEQNLIGFESFAPTAAARGADCYDWEAILRRKEQLAIELVSDWFIHADADEFREAPWPGVDLLSAIRAVDSFGFNAIDFDVLNFWPTHDGFQPGGDVRTAFEYYERAREWDKVQVKCWKRTAVAVDLVSTGGHEALFSGRRIFPIRFLLRHYPLRGTAHAARKIFVDRVPRFREEERARGWHCQYDSFTDTQSFIRDPATLTRYDEPRVKLDLLLTHREGEARGGGDAADALLDQAARYAARLEQDLDGRNRELADLHAALGDRDAQMASLHTRLRERDAQLESLHTELSHRNETVEALHRDLDARNREVEGLQRELDARNHERLRLEAEIAGLKTGAVDG